jgi:membrane-associated phospholipid phosphatase
MVRRRVGAFVARRLSSEEYLGLHLTIGLLICLLLLSAFAAIAHNVIVERELTEFDTRFGRDLEEHRLASPAVRDTFVVITQFGSVIGILSLAILVALVLMIRRRKLVAVVWLLALVVTGLLNFGLKTAIGRDRPPFRDPAIHETNESFPSGHSMGSIVTYGLLAYLLFLTVKGRVARAALVIVALLIVLAIGFSRIYLGAHYASDVVGGFAVGGAWLAACISGIETARRRAHHKHHRHHLRASGGCEPPGNPQQGVHTPRSPDESR